MDLENRTYAVFSKVKLPTLTPVYTPTTNPEDCLCDPYLVFAKNGGKSWENDTITPFIKLYSATDMALFEVFFNGVLAGIQPTPEIIPNDNGFSKMAVIPWLEYLNQDGIGCYTVKITYNIAGAIGVIDWMNAEYKLREFSIYEVSKTIRIKTVFNSQQSLEDINFTNSNLLNTYRLEGYFGDRQPKMVINNLDYSNRKTEKVTRENLNEYQLFTKGLSINNIILLTDFYFLSENELYISDFNAVNPSYSYLDVAMVVAESPEIKYFDGVRKSTLSIKLNDKLKNSRSFY